MGSVRVFILWIFRVLRVRNQSLVARFQVAGNERERRKRKR